MPTTENTPLPDAAARSSARRWTWPILTLLIGVAMSLVLWASALHSVRKLEAQKFQTIVKRAARLIEFRMRTYVYGLRGGRGIYVASKSVEREGWRRYVLSRDLPREFPGALGFGFIEYVPRAQLDSFLAQTRADAAPNFKIRSEGNRDDLMVIKFIEPLEDNLPALGYDIGSDPTRRAAAEHAMLTGEPTLTAPVQLQQSGRPGALYLIPIYRDNINPPPQSERREKILGWVYAPIVVEALLRDAPAMFDNLVDVDIFDGATPTSACLLLDPDGNLASVSGNVDMRRHYAGRTYHDSITLTVGERPWTLIVSTSPQFDAERNRSGTTLILVSCLLASALVAVVVYFLKSAHADAVALANRMTVELQGAKQRADEASTAKSAFIANMSHEIRTPMCAVIGYADLMIAPEQSDEQRKNCLQGIRRNGRHLLELINDMLDLSKIEAGKLTVEREHLSLPQLLEDVCSMMRPRADEKGLKFTLKCDGPLPPRVLTDSLRLKQTLVNLIGNAIKFTSEGFVTVTVSCDGPAEHCAVHVTVADSGVGIAPEVLARLFQPFEQADGSTTRKFGGSGLGLAISKRLANLLGGDIVAKSAAGQGSAFTLTFDAGPVQPGQLITGISEDKAHGAASGTTMAASPTTSALKGLRVLLVDDGPDNRAIVGHHLQRAGAHVTVAENGVKAIEIAMSQIFGVVLMDMQMPEMDGYAATRELRRQGYGVPIIALTANAMSEDRDKCLAAGCTEYLPKPVDRDLLIRTLLRVTGRSTTSEAA